MFLFSTAERLPLSCKSISRSRFIGNNNVVKDSAGLHLPEVNPNEAEIELGELRVVKVFRVGDLLHLPNAYVLIVLYLLRSPLALPSVIVHHRCLPITILLIVPIVRPDGRWIRNAPLLHPTIWLLVKRVIHLGIVMPILGLLVVRILDLLRLQQLPIFLEFSPIDFRLINVHLTCVVVVQGQSVQMGCSYHLLLVRHVMLLQHIIAPVSKDQMSPLLVAAPVWTEHDVVLSRIAKHLAIILLHGAHLDVATTTINILVILDLVLDDDVLAPIVEWWEIGGNVIEPIIRECLQASVLLLVTKILTSIQLKLTGGAIFFLPFTFHPAGLPRIVKSFSKIRFPSDYTQRT
mmetsp:Transcript_143897/g.253859  ORF Transcript_143897/g.253859 Transcript_143897/m.253859 type:complete len:348 (-) Transcript_143897:88-1131(-)